MYNHYFTYRSSLIVGVQGHLDYYREKLLNPTPWIAANSVRNYDFDRNEREAGAYAEYTYASRTSSRSWPDFAATTITITTAFSSRPAAT